MHLHHGTWSSLQTLGFTSTAAARTRAKTAGWVWRSSSPAASRLPLSVLLGLIEK